MRCPDCYKSYTGFEPVQAPDSDISRDSLESCLRDEKLRSQQRQQRAQTKKKFGLQTPGQDANGISLGKGPNSSFLDVYDWDSQEPLLMSTKLRAVRKIVRRWQSEAPSDKIMIFTQFTLGVKRIGRMLELENIQVLYYTGGLGEGEREKAVKAFEQKKAIKVMVRKSIKIRPRISLTIRRS